jgi:hypothetical protein
MVTALRDKAGVMAAITAAVTAYLEEEDRARLAAATQAGPVAPVSLWRVFGRRDAMRPPVLGRWTVV